MSKRCPICWCPLDKHSPNTCNSSIIRDTLKTDYMAKREANFGLLFRRWLKSQKNMPSAAFELKQTTKHYIPFNALAEHQENALLAVNSSKGILYKAPDDSRGVKPFDYFFLSRSCAFVVIRYPNTFEVIPIDSWIMEREKSHRKSLTSERARQISTISVKL